MGNDKVMDIRELDSLIKQRRDKIAELLEGDSNLEIILNGHDKVMSGFDCEYNTRYHNLMRHIESNDHVNLMYVAKRRTNFTLWKLVHDDNDSKSDYMVKIIDTFIYKYGVKASSVYLNNNIDTAIRILLTSMDCDDSLSYLDRGLAIINEFNDPKGHYDKDLLNAVVKSQKFISPKSFDSFNEEKAVKKVLDYFSDQTKQDKFYFTFDILNAVDVNPTTFSDVIDYVENNDKKYFDEYFDLETITSYFKNYNLIENKKFRLNLNLEEMNNLNFFLDYYKNMPFEYKGLFRKNLSSSLNKVISEDNSLQENKVKLNEWLGKAINCTCLIRRDRVKSFNYMTCSLFKDIDIFQSLSVDEYFKLMTFNDLCKNYISINENKKAFLDKGDVSLGELYSNIFNEIKSNAENVSVQKRMLLEFASNASKLIKEGQYDDFRLIMRGYC
ncbi:hypothetical protein HN385_03470 [archaeon]|jgi:hypothetical protein|nr:hypothetical protein [archaeon]MBT3450691.1 hypothetical protein [archaeon]MBT6869756.1 hypothetical protein [archaeon]MBT7192711.1 hypothetical protein [archaeon]MBT7380736.1 hypothetical protein [archaeon]